jgi:DNA-directed RNA polymerase subunit RPC12/RpoP
MSYLDLFNYVNTLESSEDPCLVCYLGKKEDLKQLSCGHYYHQECLKNQINCPYCGKKIITNPTTNSNLNLNININLNHNLCSTILKSGTRKGQICGRKNCHYHFNQ